MKLFFVLILFILSSCTDKQKRVSSGITKLSTAQIFLNNLRDSLKAEYVTADSETMKQAILDKYHKRLQIYLMKNPIDSICVTVDEIIVDEWTVTTRFHHNNIQFQYQFPVLKSMAKINDSLFRFLKGFETGQDVLVNFSFMGACRVNRPDDNALPTLLIFAFPLPLAFNGK
jgi:hypothetical protein